MKTLRPCEHDWSAWSAWSKTVLIGVFTRWSVFFKFSYPTLKTWYLIHYWRYRLCYSSAACSYLETEYANNKDSSKRPTLFETRQCDVTGYQRQCPWWMWFNFFIYFWLKTFLKYKIFWYFSYFWMMTLCAIQLEMKDHREHRSKQWNIFRQNLKKN